MKHVIIGLGVSALAAAAMLVPQEAAAADCQWHVEGKVSVNHRLDKLLAEQPNSPLRNAEIRISAKTKTGVWGTWNSWGTVRTNDSGVFEIDKSKDCSARRFKVEIKFQDSQLEVRHETSTSSTTKVKWYTVLEEDSGSHASTNVSLGEHKFRAGGPEDLGNDEAWSHADIWVLYKEAIGQLAALGPALAFGSKVEVKYPHNSALVSDTKEASYANPTTKVIYIFRSADGKRDELTSGTLLHELGHRWAYENQSGEVCLTESLLTTGETHGLVDDHCVAFGEGFAEYFRDELEELMFGDSNTLPYNREYLGQGIGGEPLGNIARLQRHDYGWRSVLRTLTLPELHRYDFREPYSGGTVTGNTVDRLATSPRGCKSPAIGFAEVLRVFEADSGAGYPKALGRDETTVDAFLDRAAAVLAGLSTADRDAIQEIVAPDKTVQPRDRFCH